MMRIGTMIRGGIKTMASLERFIPIGIESVQLCFWDHVPQDIDQDWLERVVRRCQESHMIISSLSFFTNPFRSDDEWETSRKGWERLIALAGEGGIPVVSGFTGRVVGESVEKSLGPIKSFFLPLVERAHMADVKIAFENCPMGGDWQSGDWNIAFSPASWEILFNDLFETPHVGLEFDPSHCPALGQDGLSLAREWLSRIIHVHGKDTLPGGDRMFCFPGSGLFDWPSFINLLISSGYGGTLDLEGYHGAFTSHGDEVERQKSSLQYLIKLRS